jgi:hypothetical protein
LIFWSQARREGADNGMNGMPAGGVPAESVPEWVLTALSQMFYKRV